MNSQATTSNRIVIVGGGISGLSIAARLSEGGLSVTVLEASHLGFGATTRNQGWLHSGAWFASIDVDLARMCSESLHRTLSFCPECVEPNHSTMIYLMANPETKPDQWTTAWEKAEISYEKLSDDRRSELLPNLVVPPTTHAYRLPDRAIRTDILLSRLALAAEQAGAEIRTGTSVARLIQRDDQILGVETTQGESIYARLVILAANAKGGNLFPDLGNDSIGRQSDVELVALKTHLLSMRPEVCQQPFCIVDADGLNHIPHRPTSVFGLNRWLPVQHDEHERMLSDEIERIWEQIQRFFPSIRRDEFQTLSWAGTTVQAMHLDDVEPGRTPLPTVVDHSLEAPRLHRLLSVFPGRASLWGNLAEQTWKLVVQQLDLVTPQATLPPWCSQGEERDPDPHATPSQENWLLYHCQKCGHVVSREMDQSPPICCDLVMEEAGECRPKTKQVNVETPLADKH